MLEPPTHTHARPIGRHTPYKASVTRPARHHTPYKASVTRPARHHTPYRAELLYVRYLRTSVYLRRLFCLWLSGQPFRQPFRNPSSHSLNIHLHPANFLLSPPSSRLSPRLQTSPVHLAVFLTPTFYRKLHDGRPAQ